MLRLLRTIGAVLLSLAVLRELGWISYNHPKLQEIHEVLAKVVKLMEYLLFT